MAKVTSKLQVTIPKALADQYAIRPGDEIDWLPAGTSIRVVPATRVRRSRDASFRLKLFREMLARQRAREASRPASTTPATSVDRGWTREELYTRGGPR